ncbi:MAG: FBP domain-containing protein [bacterium]
MENVLQPVTPQAIKQIFPGTTLQDLGTPDLTFIDWGVLDYFGWIHPTGHAGCVIAPINGELRGMQMRRMKNHSARPRTHMCSWCHHVYRSRGTAMFSTRVAGSDGRRRIGNYICQSLDCSIRIRNLASDPPTYLPETIELSHKVWRLQTNITSFMARANLLADLF